jgi:leucyl aminopeptidase (aminopeptidase T)
MSIDGLKRLLLINLGVVAGDRLLVLTDTPPAGVAPPAEWADRIALAKEAVKAARQLGVEAVLVTYPARESAGMEPPREVWEATFGEAPVAALDAGGLLVPLLAKTLSAERIATLTLSPWCTAALALTQRSTSHTRFRGLVTKGGARYASCPLFARGMLEGPMAIDWPVVAAVTRQVAERMTVATTARISCPLGTELFLSLAGRAAQADTGLLTAPGIFGNLPAGEAYIAPVEGSVEGILVITHAPTARLSSPVRVRIEKGCAVAVEGEDPYRATLEAIFARDPANRVVAELGVGTNPKAADPVNVLEAEKIAGTVHLAFGDNRTFGGANSAPYHGDSVIFDPGLWFDEERVDLTALRAPTNP